MVTVIFKVLIEDAVETVSYFVTMLGASGFLLHNLLRSEYSLRLRQFVGYLPTSVFVSNEDGSTAYDMIVETAIRISIAS